jgi:hypothetical protein
MTTHLDIEKEREAAIKWAEAEFHGCDWFDANELDLVVRGWLARASLQADEGKDAAVEAERKGWQDGMQEAQELLSGEIRDAERYEYLLDCDYIAAKKYLPDLDESEYKAKLRAKHDAALTAKEKP